jgi:hypothetical protein
MFPFVEFDNPQVREKLYPLVFFQALMLPVATIDTGLAVVLPFVLCVKPTAVVFAVEVK